MARSMRDLFEEAMKLDPAERLALTGLLIESFDANTEEGVEEAWVAEIERRMSEIDAATAKSVSWEQLRTRLYSRPGAPESR
jgi:putative addiction module component (TIGR02574 family)